jgi:predicted TPR repeat methyltransferase
MQDDFFDKVYHLDTPERARDLYDDWADSYDADLDRAGYATPARVASALFHVRPESDLPILDFGCGTGLSGQALARVGFEVIDGMDPSPEMLAQARDKGVYRNLVQLDLDDPAPIPQDVYRAITAAGVIGPGAAPLATFDMLMRALPPEGLLAFSFNDHALSDPQYEGKLAEWLDCGAARLLVREYGPHLPEKNIKANVYVVEKA